MPVNTIDTVVARAVYQANAARVHPNMNKTSLLTVAAALAAASFAGSASAREAALAGDYVGPLHGSSSSFVAVALGAHGSVNAYLSNGHQLAQRFAGSTADGTLDLESRDGYRLRLTLTYGRASGIVRFPSGASSSFSAAAVAAPGGIQRILVGPADRQTLGGWIVWNTGSTVGRIVPSPSTQVEHRAA
jgi:hypothetical protein